MEKYGDAHEFDVLEGREAQVLNEHMNKLGKYKVSDFTEKQLDSLRSDLDEARKADSESEEESDS